MAYLGSWKIDDFLSFYCNTHNASTGAAADADAVPTYAVYEDETGTAIATGSMALLDSAGTVGFYSERIQLTTAIGYEKGKQYVIYVTATVSSVAGTMSHTFQMEAEVDANTVSGTVTPAANSITSSVIATDAIGAAQIAASAIGASEIATGAITSAKFAAGAIDAATIATGAIDADALAADAGTEIANAVWALDATGQQTQGTFGQAIGDPGATAKSIWGVANALPDAGALTTLQADTDNIQTRLPAALVSGRIDCSVGAMAADVVTAAATAADFGTEVANAVWALDATGQQTQGTFGQAIGDPTTQTSLLARLPNATPGAAGGVFIAGTNAATTVTTSFTTTFTGDLTGSVGSVTTVNGLSAGTIDSILDDAVDGSYTLRQILRLLGSALGAKVSGAGTTTITFRDLADTKSRITATVDADGNRSAITLDLT